MRRPLPLIPNRPSLMQFKASKPPSARGPPFETASVGPTPRGLGGHFGRWALRLSLAFSFANVTAAPSLSLSLPPHQDSENRRLAGASWRTQAARASALLERAARSWSGQGERPMSVGFCARAVHQGRPFRVLDVVNDVTPECLTAIRDAPISS